MLKICILIVSSCFCAIWANVCSQLIFLHLDDFAISLTLAESITALLILGLVSDHNLFRASFSLIERVSVKQVVLQSFLHIFGNLLANTSLEIAGIEFTCTLRTTEIIFTILFSRMLGNKEHLGNILAMTGITLLIAISFYSNVPTNGSLSSYRIQSANTSVPIIAAFGFTVLSSTYHFGQYGASYAMDREIRQRFGDVIVIPVPADADLEDKTDIKLGWADRVVYNWEGTFHGESENLIRHVSISQNQRLTSSLLPHQHSMVSREARLLKQKP